MAEGAAFFGASVSATTVRVRHDAPEDVPATKHDQRFWIAELRLTAAYGLSDSLAMEVQFPYRVTRTTVTFDPLGAEPLPPGYESIHHRNQTITGFADPRVGGRTGWNVAGTSIAMLLGLTVPLGNIEPNPFVLGDEGKKHEHLQYGTGTFNPVVDLHAQRQLGKLSASAGASALLPWQENQHGYQAGIRVNGGVQAGFPAWRKLEPGLRIGVAHEEAERWDGKVQKDGNVGRTDVLLGASLGYPIGAYRASLDVAVPVWRRLASRHGDQGQLEIPGVLGLGITRSFGGEPAE